MKKTIRILLITLIAMLALCCVTLAAEADPPTVTAAEGVNATAAFQAGYEKLDVTYNDSAIVSGGQYMFFLVKKNESDTYIPSETSILYMDQVTASAAGTVSYTGLYPTKVEDCAVMVSGTGLTEPKIVAYVVVPVPPYTLGMVNDDDKINSTDAVMALQHSVGLITLTDTQILAADVNKDTRVNSTDAVMILQYSVGLITDWNQ